MAASRVAGEMREVRLEQGVIRYREEGSGQTLLFVHGIPRPEPGRDAAMRRASRSWVQSDLDGHVWRVQSARVRAFLVGVARA